jgi:hypothetical protein
VGGGGERERERSSIDNQKVTEEKGFSRAKAVIPKQKQSFQGKSSQQVDAERDRARRRRKLELTGTRAD